MTKVSHSMLSTWRRCRQKFEWSYLDNYVSPPSLGLARGSAGHQALALYYTGQIDSLKQLLDAAWDAFDAELPDDVGGTEINEEFELLEQALERYYPYAQANDKFTVREVEKHFVLPLDADGGHQLQGYIDAIVDYHGSTWMMEHKFNKRVSTKHLDMDPQVSMYLLGATLLDLEPAGIIYNIIRIGSGPTAEREPVVRKNVYRNLAGLEFFVQEVRVQAEEISKAWDRSPEVPIYRNPTKDCNWDCQFKNVCLAITDDGDPRPVLATFDKKERH